MYVCRATGEKVAHRCFNGYLRHQLALNDELYAWDVCKLLVILLLPFLGTCERSMSMCWKPNVSPWQSELVHCRLLEAVYSEGVQNEVRGESCGL